MIEENEFNSDLETPPSDRGIFVKIITNKKLIITLSTLFIFITLEFMTDFIEVTIGSIIELTNPFRSKSGTIWERHKKDLIANDQMKEISRSVPEKNEEISKISDLLQLKAELQNKETVMITADQFRTLYNQIPPRISYDVISPFDLLKLYHSKKWIWTKIVKTETLLSIYFLDGERQLLMDSYPSLSVLYNIPQTENRHEVALDSMNIYQGRTITSDQFFSAFDDLSNSIKRQIISNPFQLIKWDKNIRKVAISRYSIDNIVNVAFEINQGIYTEIYTFEARELAVYYLITKLNDLHSELYIDYPENKYREHPNY